MILLFVSYKKKTHTKGNITRNIVQNNIYLVIQRIKLPNVINISTITNMPNIVTHLNNKMTNLIYLNQYSIKMHHFHNHHV